MSYEKIKSKSVVIHYYIENTACRQLTQNDDALGTFVYFINPSWTGKAFGLLEEMVAFSNFYDVSKSDNQSLG